MNHTEQTNIVIVKKSQSAPPAIDHGNKRAIAEGLLAIQGHPLDTLTRENETLVQLLKETEGALREGKDIRSFIEQIRELSIHYAKKGDLLYPHLKSKYGVAGPSDLLWTDDDEIRDELIALSKEITHDEAWVKRICDVLGRADEMIYKEANILFPMCAVHFTEEEWIGIYRDLKDYGDCFGVKGEVWKEAENKLDRYEQMNASAKGTDTIVMPGGHLTVEQLTAMLNTLPIEITFVDAENINCYFNEGPKVFKRPGMAIDREVFSCHPPKIEKMVRAIIEDFRNNRKDRVPVWIDKGGKPFLVTYMAVRDKKNTYLGTVEVVQDLEFAKKHFEDKNYSNRSEAED